MSLPKHSTGNLQVDVRDTSRRVCMYPFLKALLLIGGVALLSWKFSHLELLRFGLEGGPEAQVQAASGGDDFDWSSITPSEDLDWNPCYKEFQCARLTVPLDYSDLNTGEAQAAVALVRYPSTVPHDEEGYLGPVLFNPGGPGASGVEMIVGNAKQFRTILGEGFDLVGFDPRGLGFTTPKLDVFHSAGEAGILYASLISAVNSSNTALGTMYATAQTIGDLAEARMGDVSRHVGTPVVARDMLSIVKAHGQEKLQYWGFSYGTVLGATFAAMFPDNVGRLVLDGVMDVNDYYTAQWSTNLLDTDNTLMQFCQACVDAGPLLCPIHEDTAEQIHVRVQRLLAHLRSHPLSFFNSTTGSYGQVTYSLVQRVLLRMLYSPYTSGRPVASALASLERRNAEPIYQLSETKEANDLVTETCTCPAAPTDPWRNDKWENALAIMCGDGDEITDDMDTFRKYYDGMAKMSLFAEAWWPRLGCSGWKVRAKERFNASWETSTSFPLLIVGNTADPVTPLSSAKKMSQGFKKSVVLTQDSPGHCSLAAASLCTTKAIRAYFQNGTLPKEGTICDVESRIFYGQLRVSADDIEEDDRDLLRASHVLQQNYVVPMF